MSGTPPRSTGCAHSGERSARAPPHRQASKRVSAARRNDPIILSAMDIPIRAAATEDDMTSSQEQLVGRIARLIPVPVAEVLEKVAELPHAAARHLHADQYAA